MESMMEKITSKRHGCDSPSSSVSKDRNMSPVEAVKSKSCRLLEGEKPLHKVLGGGKPADVFLWRNKTISASVLGRATAIWVLFEMLEYHLLPLLCHILMLCLASLFLWSNASIILKKSPPDISVVGVPEKAVIEIASALLFEINRGLTLPHNIASGRHLKQFLAVIAGSWVLSAVGKWCNFITLFYILFVVLHTVPVMYERYEDEADTLAEEVQTEIKRQFRVFCKRVLSGQPRDVLKQTALICPQTHRMEKNQNFGAMCLELVETYVQANKVKPEKIVVFRDGVSEGQFDMVLNEELLDLKRAIQGRNYCPTITLIVTWKRHLTQMFF